MEMFENLKENYYNLKTQIATQIQNLGLSIATSIKDSTFMEYLRNTFTSQQIVLWGTIITFILLILLFIFLIFIILKINKALKKRGYLIDFSLKDFFGAWGIFFLIGAAAVIYSMFKTGFDLNYIPVLMVMFAWGIYGVFQQKSKIELIRYCGYTGIKFWIRFIFNFVCGILSIFFLRILIPIAIFKYLFHLWTDPVTPDELKEINREQENLNKRRVEFNYYTDGDGNTGVATTYHHTDNFSSTTYTDKDGEKHIIYKHKY